MGRMPMPSATLVLLLVLLAGHVHARTVYVSNSGNDKNSGTSPGSPVKTLSRVASMRGWKQGDKILLARGSVFYDSLGRDSFTPHGTTIGNYGNEGKPLPVISGGTAVPSGAWSNYKGQIWKAKVAGVPGKTHVYYKGSMLTPARSKLYITKDSFGNGVSATGISGACAGGKATIRVAPGLYQTVDVTSAGGGRIAWDQGVGFRQTSAGWGLFCWNRLALLDTPGEWFYDSASDTLYVWLPASASPKSSPPVIVGVQDVGIGLRQAVGAVVQGIRFEYQLGYAVYGVSPMNAVIQNCQFNGQLDAAIALGGGRGARIQNNVITNSAEGIRINGADNAQVLNNRLSGVGMKAMYTKGGDVLDGTGIIVIEASGVRVVGNSLNNIGGTGIRLDGTGNTAQGNSITNVMMTLNDGGGIYLHGPEASGNTIIGNTINGVPGNMQGCGMALMAHGIYLDNMPTDIKIIGNKVSNAGFNGILIHGGTGHTVKNNVLSSIKGDYMLHLNDRVGSTGNIEITGNTFNVARGNQIAIQEQSPIGYNGNSHPEIANYHDNKYHTQCGQRYLFRTAYGGVGRFFNFKAWQQTYGYDKGSSVTC